MDEEKDVGRGCGVRREVVWKEGSVWEGGGKRERGKV